MESSHSGYAHIASIQDTSRAQDHREKKTIQSTVGKRRSKGQARTGQTMDTCLYISVSMEMCQATSKGSSLRAEFHGKEKHQDLYQRKPRAVQLNPLIPGMFSQEPREIPRFQILYRLYFPTNKIKFIN